MPEKLGEIMVFLPNKNSIIAFGEQFQSMPTYNEIIRTLFHFPKYSKRINFVTGLFEHTPEEFQKMHYPITSFSERI